MTYNSELLDHYVERYNAGDLDAVMDLYHVSSGKDDFTKKMRERLQTT